MTMLSSLDVCQETSNNNVLHFFLKKENYEAVFPVTLFSWFSIKDGKPRHCAFHEWVSGI